MAELVDALDSKSSFLGRVGSIPTLSTKWEISEKLSPFSFFRPFNSYDEVVSKNLIKDKIENIDNEGLN